MTGDTPTTFPIVGLYQLRRNAGDRLIRIQNQKVEWDNAGTWTDLTGAATISASADDRWTFDTFRGNAVFTNGVNVPLKWDGAAGTVSEIVKTVTGGSDIDTAATLIMHRERIVLGDVTQGGVRAESRILPSDGSTLDTWDQNNDIDIGDGDGDSITAFAESRDFLIVFKQHSLWRIADLGVSGSQTVDRVASVGTPGPHSVCVMGTLVIFLDDVGRLWAYDPIGENEDSLIEVTRDKLGERTFDNFKKDRLRYAHLFHRASENEVYSFISNGQAATETNRAWVYNATSRGFTPMEWADNWNVVARVIDADGEPQMVGGSYDGLVAQLETGTSDNGAAIEAYVVSPMIHVGAMDFIKGMRWFDYYLSIDESQEIEVSYRRDFNPSGTARLRQVDMGGAKLGIDFVLGESTLARRGEIIDGYRLEGYPRWVQFKFRQKDTKDVTFLGYVLYFTLAGEHR